MLQISRTFFSVAGMRQMMFDVTILSIVLQVNGTFLITQLVKNPPAMQETLVRFLGLEDPLEKG